VRNELLVLGSLILSACGDGSPPIAPSVERMSGVWMGHITLTSVRNVLGIPHNDFHVFDGSVLPGYVDGVVVIPEEVNPFCDKCGWF